jgi:hypothetical protein
MTDQGAIRWVLVFSETWRSEGWESLLYLAVSLSDPARVPGMSGLAVVPNGFSTDVYALLITNPAVQRGL